MRKVFADTLYWLAILRPGDSWKHAAVTARAEVGPCRLVTTDEVLCELLSALARGGPATRKVAVDAVREMLTSAEVLVIPQSRDSLVAALTRYSQRLDKDYSLVDCASMNAMDAEMVYDLLSNDHHFLQEGYNVLIRGR